MSEGGATHGGSGRAGTRNVHNVVLFSWDHVVKAPGGPGCPGEDSAGLQIIFYGRIEVVGRCGVEKRVTYML